MAVANLWLTLVLEGVHQQKRTCTLVQVLVLLRLSLAPRPGLEPGTYGLTVPPSKCLHVLIAMRTLYVNQHVRLSLLVKHTVSALIGIRQNAGKLATWWLHGGYMAATWRLHDGVSDGTTQGRRTD